jgi:ubiquitin-conjugating enzyme E2 S
MSHENLPPVVLRIISKELRKLVVNPPDGVRLLPEYNDSGDNIAEVYAELTGPDATPFEGGSFVVKLHIGPEYPSTPPKGFFLTKIYHPNVGPQGEICVNTLKRDWKPDLGLSHVLKVIWCLLINPFPESSLNDEAGKLFMESYEEYAKKARMNTKIHAKRKNRASDDCGHSHEAAILETDASLPSSSLSPTTGTLASSETSTDMLQTSLHPKPTGDIEAHFAGQMKKRANSLRAKAPRIVRSSSEKRACDDSKICVGLLLSGAPICL